MARQMFNIVILFGRFQTHLIFFIEIGLPKVVHETKSATFCLNCRLKNSCTSSTVKLTFEVKILVDMKVESTSDIDVVSTSDIDVVSTSDIDVVSTSAIDVVSTSAIDVVSTSSIDVVSTSGIDVVMPSNYWSI